MKIGILTHFHKSINYGGVLQAYALCKHLEKQGHTVQQILYTAQVRRLDPPELTLKDKYQKIIKRIQRRYNASRNIAVKKRMESLFFPFRDFVSHTENEYTKQNITDIAEEFDIIIAGSDQIWNPDWYDGTYMLDFVGPSVSKISYAASMGVSTLTQQQKKTYKEHLGSLKKISVRETEAAEILSEALEREVEVCVDPTLLLSAEDWDEIAGKKKTGERYVFLYMLGDDIKVKKLAEKFAKQKSLRLVFIPDLIGEYRPSDKKLKGEAVTDATPNDFISLIKHADYIFTDSFHACVFSLLYKKEFFAFERCAAQKTGSRIRNLTEMFACADRFCATEKERSLNYLTECPPIDYFSQKPLFEKAKQSSAQFLDMSISDDLSKR